MSRYFEWFRFDLTESERNAEASSSEPAQSDAWADWEPRRRKDRDELNKNRDGDVPDWDGKESHRTTYFRKVDICPSDV